jgi:hypothetical protein
MPAFEDNHGNRAVCLLALDGVGWKPQSTKMEDL